MSYQLKDYNPNYYGSPNPIDPNTGQTAIDPSTGQPYNFLGNGTTLKSTINTGTLAVAGLMAGGIFLLWRYRLKRYGA